MTDIFDNKILCKDCGKEMARSFVVKDGFKLRAIKCDKCREIIIHPEDKAEYQDLKNLKKKNYRLKLRLVGNSYAVSIPKEIVEFMDEHVNESEKRFKRMVDLCLEDFRRVSLNFD